MAINQETREKIKPQYLKIFRQIDWKVMYDADKNLENEMYDLQLMLTGTKKDDENSAPEQKFGFIQVTFNQNVSFENFILAKRRANEGELARFIDILDSLIYPYDKGDVIAQALHLGWKIDDIYKVQNGKLNFVFRAEQLKELISTFVLKGSPLVNYVQANRPKKIKARKTNYINSNPRFLGTPLTE